MHQIGWQQRCNLGVQPGRWLTGPAAAAAASAAAATTSNSNSISMISMSCASHGSRLQDCSCRCHSNKQLVGQLKYRKLKVHTQ